MSKHDKDEAPSTDADIMPTSYLKGHEGENDTDVSRSYTIGLPRQRVYEAVRDFASWPTFMENLKSIEMLDERRSHWVVAGPAGVEVEFDSEIVEDVPGERIAWEADKNAQIANSGYIEFKDAPGDRGTHLRAFLSYDPPAGAIGKAIAKVFQREPNIQMRRDLRRLKQLLETGEITTSKAPEAAPRA